MKNKNELIEDELSSLELQLHSPLIESDRIVIRQFISDLIHASVMDSSYIEAAGEFEENRKKSK